MAAPSWKNLVLEGGGVWGIGTVGALQVLEERGLLNAVERVAGTSAGSIVALLLALGYSASEIRAIMDGLDFSMFEDDPDPLRLVTEYGYFRGAFALELFRGYVRDRLGDPDATFGDLQARGGRDLRVFATSLATHELLEFSARTRPGLSLATAVRSSMSIPLFFAAVNLDGQVLVDGGTVYNYPFFAFGDQSETLGIGFAHSSSTPSGGTPVSPFGYDCPVDYVRALFETLLDAQASVWLQDATIREHTILIHTGSVRATDFNLTAAQKVELFDNGAAAARAFLGELPEVP